MVTGVTKTAPIGDCLITSTDKCFSKNLRWHILDALVTPRNRPGTSIVNIRPDHFLLGCSIHQVIAQQLVKCELGKAGRAMSAAEIQRLQNPLGLKLRHRNRRTDPGPYLGDRRERGRRKVEIGDARRVGAAARYHLGSWDHPFGTVSRCLNPHRAVLILPFVLANAGLRAVKDLPLPDRQEPRRRGSQHRGDKGTGRSVGGIADLSPTPESKTVIAVIVCKLWQFGVVYCHDPPFEYLSTPSYDRLQQLQMSHRVADQS